MASFKKSYGDDGRPILIFVKKDCQDEEEFYLDENGYSWMYKGKVGSICKSKCKNTT